MNASKNKKKTSKKKIVKKNSKKTNKKNKQQSKKPKKNNNIYSQTTEIKNVLYLDNVKTSTLCTNAEKIYKKLISDKNNKPTENEKLVNISTDFLLKHCNGNDQYSLFFTPGYAESNNIFLCSAVNAYKKIRKIIPHVVISSIENESIIKHANSLKDSGQIELTFIQPNIYGCILSENVASVLKPNTCCVLITYINQELGSVNNIEKISKILHDKKIPLHSDCTYLFGRHKLDLGKTNIDSVTIDFDKIGGPVGLGAIIIKNDLLQGYKLYEHSSTLENKGIKNIPMIAAAVESVKCSFINRSAKNKMLLKLRNEIIGKLTNKYQMMTYLDFINSDDSPLEESSKSKVKIILLGPPANNESYYTPSILSLAIINKKKKTGKDIQTELEKKNIIIGVPKLNGIYNNNSALTNKQMIRITLSDNITMSDITIFLNALYKII